MTTLDYLDLKTIHILGATAVVAFGFGIGFFMLISHLTRDPIFVGPMGVVIVAADIVFAVSSGLVQPASGALLMQQSGFGLRDGWLAVSLALYALAGLSWLPIIVLQLRMRRIALLSARDGTALPASYDRLSRRWFLSALPGFAAVLIILWLMITKPALF